MNTHDGPQVVRRIDAGGEVRLTKPEYEAFVANEWPDHDLVIDVGASAAWKRLNAKSPMERVRLCRMDRLILERLIVTGVPMRAGDLKVHERSIRNTRWKVEFRSRKKGLLGPAVMRFRQGDTPRENTWSLAPADGLRWCLFLPIPPVDGTPQPEAASSGVSIACFHAQYLLDEHAMVVSVDVENPTERPSTIKRFELEVGSLTLHTCDGPSCLPGYVDDVGWLERLSLALPALGARTGTLAFEIDDPNAALVPTLGVNARLRAVLVGNETLECRILVRREPPRI